MNNNHSLKGASMVGKTFRMQGMTLEVVAVDEVFATVKNVANGKTASMGRKVAENMTADIVRVRIMVCGSSFIVDDAVGGGVLITGKVRDMCTLGDKLRKRNMAVVNHATFKFDFPKAD